MRFHAGGVGLEAPGRVSWGPLGGPPEEASRRALPSHAFGDGCSEATASEAANMSRSICSLTQPLPIVQQPSEKALQLRPLGGPGAPLGAPSNSQAGAPLASSPSPHGLQPPTQRWQQLLGVPAAPPPLPSGPPAPPVSAQGPPLNGAKQCGPDGVLGGPPSAGPSAAAGAPPWGSVAQSPQEKEALLQQLHQNEQMQHQILRSLQQQQRQQRRWRRLLEACEGPPPSPVNSLEGSSAAQAALLPSSGALFSTRVSASQQGGAQLSLREPLESSEISPQTVAAAAPTAAACAPSGVPGAPPLGRGGAPPIWGLFPYGGMQELAAPPAKAAAAAETPTESYCPPPSGELSTSAAAAAPPPQVSYAMPSALSGLQATALTTPGETCPLAFAGEAFARGCRSGAGNALRGLPEGPLLSADTPVVELSAQQFHASLPAVGAATTGAETKGATTSSLPFASTGAAGVACAVGGDCRSLSEAACACLVMPEDSSASPPEGFCAVPPPYSKAASAGGRCVKFGEGGRRRAGRRVAGRRGGRRSMCVSACVLKGAFGNANVDPKQSNSSPLALSRSPSVARTAACAVLGFGSGMPVQTKLAEDPVIGLVNLGGGSCFLNVVLQCLAHIQPLRDFYLHYGTMLPPSQLLGRQYEAYTSYLEASRQHVRRLKRGPHQLIPTPTYTTSVTWELAVVINHMWRSPSSVRFLKPEALYQVCCRIMPDFDPREMHDSDEFLRLLLDFLDAELRAAAAGVPLHRALMMQAMPKKLSRWPFRRSASSDAAAAAAAAASVTASGRIGGEAALRAHGEANGGNVLKAPGEENTPQTELSAAATAPTRGHSAEGYYPADLCDISTLFSVFFEGAEVDKVRCTRCGRCTATLVPFKSLAVAMTREAQEESCQHASLRLKPASFFHLLSKVDLVECLNRHFADDCDSLKLSSGEGYFCEQCNSKQDAVKSCSLVQDHLPFILCLTLKRFVRGKETYKIWNPVHFDDFVDLSRYVEDSSDADAPLISEAASRTPPKAETGEAYTASWRSGIEGKPTSSNTPASDEESLNKGREAPASEAACAGVLQTAEKKPAQGPSAPDGAHAPAESRTVSTARRNELEQHASRRYTYKLVALVEHEGPATEQGHYVCYVKHIGSNAWFRADDKIVEPVDLQRVLVACPYILFYQRLSSSADCADSQHAASETCASRQSAGAANDAVAGGQSDKAGGGLGLSKQLTIASGLSMGQWQSWQQLIIRLFTSSNVVPKTGEKPEPASRGLAMNCSLLESQAHHLMGEQGAPPALEISD
ncbi:hypothetical protein cyc_03850 [Cyclospora cayetanensis]|uniref:Ubiquitin carboxyl-terminal hydrolase n=1 Tax=Cyclospora cayetanensis TaxID=88456 RepID=A0A1D3D9E3_9EIME|nr:hypothetical protein cyc_03850 [Cyclospora cayetanensis]